METKKKPAKFRSLPLKRIWIAAKEHELFECHLQKAFEDCEIQAASQDEGDDEDDDGSEDEEECEDAEATQEPAAEAEAIRKPGEAKDAQKPAAEAEAIREPSGDSGADVS